MERKLTVVYIETGSGNFVGFVSEIPGVLSQGKTLDELHSHLIDAVKCMEAFLKRTPMEHAYVAGFAQADTYETPKQYFEAKYKTEQ